MTSSISCGSAACSSDIVGRVASNSPPRACKCYFATWANPLHVGFLRAAMHEPTQERRGAVALGEDGEEVHGSATVLSSISGLTNTIIGAGMLALPHAYATMGWLLGTVLVLLCAVVTNFGLHLVKLCEVRMERRPQSFYDMTSQVMPSAVWYFDATIFVKVCCSAAHTVLWRRRILPDDLRAPDAPSGTELCTVDPW